MIREIAYCYTEGSFCQTWINTQQPNQKPIASHFASPKPIRNKIQPNVLQRRETPLSNAINSNLFYNSRSYKPPAYVPQNFQCGFPYVRNKPKHYLWGMLRIIGGKTARKGQWPWQAAILNRFKVSALFLKKNLPISHTCFYHLTGSFLWWNIGFTAVGSYGSALCT